MERDPAVSFEWWQPGLPAGSTVPEITPPSRLPGAGSSVPFWGLMAFLFIWIIAPQNLFPSLAPLRLALVAAAVSVGGYLYDRFARGRPAGRRTPAIWIAAGILAWASIIVPLSYWPTGSLMFILNVYAKTVAAFWLLSRVVSTRLRLQQVIWGVVLMGLPLAGTALSHYFSGQFTPGEYGRIAGYDSGMAKNPNDTALMLNLLLPFSIALFLGSRRWWLRAPLLAVILLYVAGVIVTYSRGGFLTLAGTLAYYLAKLMRRGRWGPAVAALVLALAAVPLLPAGYVTRLATITDTDADPTGSAQTRSKDGLIAVRMALDRPLAGFGIGMNALALNDVRGATWLRVHNVYLEYAVDLGIPGLMLFLLLLGVCLRDARAVQRQSGGRGKADGLFHAAEAAEAALVAFAIAAMFHAAAYDLFFYLVAGLAVAARTVHELEQRQFASAPVPADGNEPAVGQAWWRTSGALGERAS
jgi:O-antigen ligase